MSHNSISHNNPCARRAPGVRALRGGLLALCALALPILGALPAAAQNPDAAAAGAEAQTPFTVFVTIPPQAWLVERIAGDRARVEVLVPPGQSPHTYNPTPRLLADLARAQVFFSIGLPLERQILNRTASAFPNLRVVDTLEGVTLRRFQPHEEHRHDESDQDHAHEHGHEHGHDHHHAHDHDHENCDGQCGQDGFDPHVWLDPRVMRRQADTISEALIAMDPEGRTRYEARRQAAQEELDRLHATLTRRLAPCRGRDLFVFHPAFGYFTDAYQLRQMPIEFEGKSPTPRQLMEFIRVAREQDAKVIFVQPQFDAQSTEAVARSIGGRVAPLDPLARDYVENLRVMTRTILEAYGLAGDEEEEEDTQP